MFENLAATVNACEPAMSRNQKQYYGAISVLVDVYSEGQELPHANEVVPTLPKQTADHICMFVLLSKLLGAVAHTPNRCPTLLAWHSAPLFTGLWL